MHPFARLFSFLQRIDFLLLAHRQNMGSREASAWYPDWVYETMEYDENRNVHYREALDAAAADRVVLELGTGRKALWARYAASQGAKRVYAVEANSRSYESSKRILDSEGISKVELIHGFSDSVSIPERCDLLVHDLIGAIGSCEGMVPFLEDAKRRFLKSNAVHIPNRCRTYFFPSAMPRQTLAERVLGFLSRGGRRVQDMPLVLMFGYRSDAMLAEPELFEDLVLDEPIPEEEVRRSSFTVTRDGLWDGVVFFLRLSLGPDSEINTLTSRTNWYLPYVRPFSKPIPVQLGDTIEIDSISSRVDVTAKYEIVCRVGRGGELSEVARHCWSGV